MNRIVNLGIRVLFRHGYNDTTNAFKAYRREVIENIQPLLSHHFNLTVELPLKAVVRGYSYGIVPISWTNRTAGDSKLALQRDGQPLPLHHPLRLPRAPPQPRRLPPRRAGSPPAWDLAGRVGRAAREIRGLHQERRAGLGGVRGNSGGEAGTPLREFGRAP